MSSQRTKRQSWVDFARGVAIILVVYRHSFIGIKTSGISVENYMTLEYFNIIFFSFRMPLFFIVSGIFLAASFAKRGFARYVEVKARTILYPYFLWAILQITLQIAFGGYTNSDRNGYDYLYLLYQPRRIEQFWYLLALFNVSVLYVVLKYIAKIRRIYLIIIGITFYYLSAYLHQQHIEVGFLFDIFSYFIYIVMGDLLHTTMTNEKNIKRFQSVYVVPILLVPFIIAQLYFLKTNLAFASIAKYRYVEYYQPTAFFFIAIMGCAFVIGVCFLLQRLKRPRWLQILGKHSLYIYVSHVICFAAVRVVLTHFFHVTSVPVLFISCLVAGLLIPVFLYKMSVKMKMEWIFSLKERPLPGRKPEVIANVEKNVVIN